MTTASWMTKEVCLGWWLRCCQRCCSQRLYRYFCFLQHFSYLPLKFATFLHCYFSGYYFLFFIFYFFWIRRREVSNCGFFRIFFGKNFLPFPFFVFFTELSNPQTSPIRWPSVKILDQWSSKAEHFRNHFRSSIFSFVLFSPFRAIGWWGSSASYAIAWMWQTVQWRRILARRRGVPWCCCAYSLCLG